MTAVGIPATGRRLRVGLLGGSFNPAHEGHRHLSRHALRRLRLDQVWWLVAPQNPLKAPDDMAPLAARLAGARALRPGPRVRVTDVENDLGTRYTADTIRALKRRFPGHRFVWLMGADNLVEISRWHRWMAIFDAVPVAVFARPSYSFKALTSKAARRYARARVRESRSGAVAARTPPAWVFVHMPLSAVSATGIRARSRAKSSGAKGSGVKKRAARGR